ncbi:MAG: hypothetical protein M3N33_00865 [Actinomycetota bacterium]|nr:hypothetical protein [Actinomycetota bacterium]
MARNPELNPEHPNFAPKDLELARRHRIEDLTAIADDPGASILRRQHARQELEQIDAFGYAWPANTGYPAGYYNQADQKRRKADQ